MSSTCVILAFMKKILLILSTIFSLLVSSPRHVVAASEFTTSFDSSYTIMRSGITSVVHTITLRNNLANIYATEYTLATSGSELKNISVSDEFGPLVINSTQKNGASTIHLMINHPSIGKDKEKRLTISYQTEDTTEVIGNTLTINIPRLSRANEAESYTRTVSIEHAPGGNAYVYPAQNKVEMEGNFTKYYFSGHNSDAITLLFGDSVTYKLDLTYELKNKELGSITSELALPPDTSYQRVLLDSITPPPVEITLDKSGNWLARYNLKSQEKILVKAVLYATIFPVPTQYDPSTTNFQKSAGSKYWDTNSATVSDLASRLKTPENIYHYLTNNYTYNTNIGSGTTRLGALSAITSPSGVLCTEFTDSFVALARVLNIPSREINGYGYTKNTGLQPQNLETDILHAWPEYYDSDKKVWIQIDPTWGNTTGGIDYFNKLDYSHITFVRHGDEDSYPLPAGAYKSNSSDKYVHVEISSASPADISTYSIEDGYIKNTGNVAIRNDLVEYLPPYASKKIETKEHLTFYDKIKQLCASLLSKFSQLLRAST